MDVKNTTSKDEVAALEQWARAAKKWEMVRTDAWPDAILALCETVREQQKVHDADLTRDHTAILYWKARAEQAETILAGVHGTLMDAGDVRVRALDATLDAVVRQVVEQRDAARAEAAQLRDTVDALTNGREVACCVPR